MFLTDLRKDTNLDAKAMEAVKRRTPDAENIHIFNIQQKFLDGILYTINFDSPPDANGHRTSYTNRVYVTKNTIEAYGFDDFLFQIVGARHSKSFYDIFANGDVVSGIIALVVTLMIVPTFIVSYWKGSTIPVPDWITSGWLLILGFYFGKASGSRE